MRKGDETKREILRAAEQLFCQKGYEAASMQEIVRAAGVSKGGIYHHFASKEEIMTLLSHQHAQKSAERAAQGHPAHPPIGLRHVPPISARAGD